MRYLWLLFYLAVLILVLVLVYYTTRFVGRGISMKQSSGGMQILDRITIGRDSDLMVVRIQKRILLLGVSPAGIEKLEELDGYEKCSPTGSVPDFGTLLSARLKWQKDVTKDEGETEDGREA